jgi:hypothetical protein
LGSVDQDYVLPRVGIIAAATLDGDFADAVRDFHGPSGGARRRGGGGDTATGGDRRRRAPPAPLHMQLLPYFCPIGLSAAGSTEVHVALIAGVCAALHADAASAAVGLVPALQTEIVDLCAATGRIVNKLRRYGPRLFHPSVSPSCSVPLPLHGRSLTLDHIKTGTPTPTAGSRPTPSWHYPKACVSTWPR